MADGGLLAFFFRPRGAKHTLYGRHRCAKAARSALRDAASSSAHGGGAGGGGAEWIDSTLRIALGKRPSLHWNPTRRLRRLMEEFVGRVVGRHHCWPPPSPLRRAHAHRGRLQDIPGLDEVAAQADHGGQIIQHVTGSWARSCTRWLWPSAQSGARPRSPRAPSRALLPHSSTTSPEPPAVGRQQPGRQAAPSRRRRLGRRSLLCESPRRRLR